MKKGDWTEKAAKRKLLKSKDDFMSDRPEETDIVIPVMGPTGVGKSTFINAVLGTTKMTVGHSLNSCTPVLQHVFIFNIPGRPHLKGHRVVMVDTPGFDDTYTEDAEILRRIAVWLASSYDADMKLGGVVYLHDISQTRMLGATRTNLAVFHKLCGERADASIILGTTKWKDVSLEMGARREKQLIETYWQDHIARGSRVYRFEDSQSSAWNIIHAILDNFEGRTALRIQKELVDLQRCIPETDAGKTLRYTLEQLLEMQKKLAKDLQAQDDPESIAKLDDNRNQIRTTLRQIQDLQVTLPRRIMTFFGLT